MSLTAHAQQDPPACYWMSPGASAVSHQLARMLSEATVHARDNATDWRSFAKSEMERIAFECQSPNWDGYGADPVSQEAKRQAQRLVDMLPFSFSPPEPVPDPDGDMSLHWDFGPGHMFTVSVSANGMLNFAGLLGEGRERHGVEPFKSTVPKVVVETIEDLADRASASRKAAA